MSKKSKSKSNYKNNDLINRDKLIIENLPLVKYVVNKFLIYLPSFVDKEDLAEYGIIGLLEAAERYDQRKDTKFSTYAISRIRGSILDYLRSQDWLPRSVREKATAAQEVYFSLEQKLNRPPLPEEVASALNIGTSEWEKLLAEINFSIFLSLEEYNQKNDDNGKENRGTQFVDNKYHDPLSHLETQEEKELLVEVLKKLPKRERLVITLYYYEGLMIKEISMVLGISESRVSQLHHQGLYTLRTKMNKITLNTC